MGKALTLVALLLAGCAEQKLDPLAQGVVGAYAASLLNEAPLAPGPQVPE